MSWNITHQCRFQSRTGQQYCVNISRQADTGQNIKQLQGSEHPFVTSEANGDDIFMPIRQQTGFLRVIDKSGGALLDELLPENNTQKMVTLVNLTTGKTEWIGFLAAEVFTQPWGNELTELEFPLKSALACLSDITMELGVGNSHRMAYLVWMAFNTLFQSDVPFTDMYFLEDTDLVAAPLLLQANFNRFFDEKTIVNEGSRTQISVGASYMTAISAMCKVFGLTMRQQGTTILFAQYDNGAGSQVSINTLQWSDLEEISTTSGWGTNRQRIGWLESKDLLKIANFRGSNNKLSFIPGGKNAIVTLELGSVQGSKVLQQPESDMSGGNFNTRTLYKDAQYWFGGYKLSSDGTAFVGDIWFEDNSRETISFAWLPRRGNTYETFSNKMGVVTLLSGNSINVRRQHGDTWNDTDASQLLDRSFFRGGYDRYGQVYYSYDQSMMFTGAIPGRWGKENEVLTNAILLIQDVYGGMDTPNPVNANPQACYAIQNDRMLEMNNCYLHIDFNMPLVIYTIISQLEKTSTILQPSSGYSIKDNGSVYVSEQSNLIKPANASVGETDPIVQILYCRLKVWNDSQTYYWWDGTQWQTSERWFTITVEKGKIKSNYTESLPIDKTDGILVPINFTGYVGFEILNCVACQIGAEMEAVNDKDIKTTLPVFPFQKILTDLAIDLVYPRSSSVSTDSSNTYRKNILSSGFSEDKEITLDLGTNNNNSPSMALLKNNDGSAYITALDYVREIGNTYSERPEMHLLNRMVEYYKTVRRTMEAKIATGIDLFRNRFSYNGRKYMAIDKKHDWEREEQEVKFIEVT